MIRIINGCKHGPDSSITLRDDTGTRQRMFREGEAIESLDELVRRLEQSEYCFYRHRPLHPNFIRNMSFGTVLGVVHGKRLSVAYRNEEGQTK